jgi:hypothetical protein
VYYAEQLKKFKQYRDEEKTNSSSETEAITKYEI